MLLAACALASALAFALKPKGSFVADGKAGSHFVQQAFVALWTNTCPATDPLVQELRDRPWPNYKKGKAPTVSTVIYINMKWDPVRRDYMEHQLQNLSDTWRDNLTLSWERFEGVGASDLKHDEAYADWKEKGFTRAPYPEVAGDWAVAGCAYSHYSSIKKIPTDSRDLVMITEDDVEIDPDFPSMWEELWRWLPDEWDVVRVGWFGDHQNCSQVVNSYVDLAAWQQLPGSACMYCGAQAYIVNPSSKQKVLERFEKSRITHADMLLSAPTPLMEDPEEVPPLKAFVAWPMLAKTHFGKNGFPAFKSDRIAGRQAVETVETTKAPATEAPKHSDGAGGAVAALQDNNWLPSTSTTAAPTANPYAIHWPTTTTHGEEPVSESGEPSGAAANTTQRTQLHAEGEPKKATSAMAELRFLNNPGKDKADKKKADDSEKAAQEVAAKARQEADKKIQKKAEQLEVAAEHQVEVKVQQAQRQAAAQVEKEAEEAEQAARQANSEVAKKLKVAEEARKRAEEKAAEAERKAGEALKATHAGGGDAAKWKRAEEEAEAKERKAEREAVKADQEREKMRGQAKAVLQALDAARAERKEALNELKEETAARKKAEAARIKAEEALKEKDEEGEKDEKKEALDEKEEKDGQKEEGAAPKAPALPTISLPTISLPPMPPLPAMVTLGPLPTLTLPTMAPLEFSVAQATEVKVK